MLPHHQKLTAASGDAGRRLDLFLAEHVPELSRTRIQELIREGHVRVDGHIAKVSHRIAAGETIEMEVLPRPAPVALPEDLPLDLLLVDDDFVIVNKPAGMVVHAGAGHARGTLVNALLHRLGKLSGAAARCVRASCTAWTAKRRARWSWRGTTKRTSISPNNSARAMFEKFIWRSCTERCRAIPARSRCPFRAIRAAARA